jgi:hypothetical protein
VSRAVKYDPAFEVVTLDAYEPTTMTGPLVYNGHFLAFDSVGFRG